jgi:hypothetical protein
MRKGPVLRRLRLMSGGGLAGFGVDLGVFWRRSEGVVVAVFLGTIE